MKICFSLVGGQTFPVYAQALDCKPDIFLLFHSKQTVNNAENVEACIKRKLPKIEVHAIETDANNLEALHRTFKAHADEYLKPGNEIIVNLSGGTKPWSMQLMKIFSGRENATCVFIDQSNYIWDMGDYSKYRLDAVDISLNDMFELNGASVAQLTDYDVYQPADFTAANKLNGSIDVTKLCSKNSPIK